jgi:hypothetical protein
MAQEQKAAIFVTAAPSGVLPIAPLRHLALSTMGWGFPPKY